MVGDEARGHHDFLALHPSSVVDRLARIEAPAFVGPHCVIGRAGFQHQEWTAPDFAGGATRSTVLGPNARLIGLTFIGQGSSIGSNLRADTHSYIGEDCVLGDDLVVEYGGRIYDRVVAGDQVTVGGFVCNEARLGSGCVVQGSLVHPRTAPPPEPPPTIGEHALVGTGAVVVGNVHVGAHSVIAAGAVVTENTREGWLYAGVPARPVRSIDQWY